MILKERVKEFSNLGEIIAGSENERKIVNKIKKYLDIKKIDYNLYPFRVYNWSVKELSIECNQKRINDTEILLPFSPSHDIETKEYCIQEFNNIHEIPYLYNLNKNRCSIIIFTKDNIKRKNIVVDGSELSRNPSHPPPIPAYYLPKELVPILKGNCRFYAKVSLNPNAIGYVTEAIVPSHSENIISVSVHHDGWFNGEHSSKIGASILTLLEPKSSYHEVRLYSFTATETGNIGFPTIYWSYGSYIFLKQNKHKEKYLINININNIFPNYRLVAPYGLCNNFSDLELNCENGIIYYSDGLNFMKNGIISIDISSNNDLEKSSMDRLEENENYEELVTILNNIVSKIKEIKINSNPVLENLKFIQQKLPLRIKSYLNNFYDIIENINVYRKLLENYGIILYLSNINMNVSLFHRLLGLLEAIKGNDKVMIEDLRLIENECTNIECRRMYNIYVNETLRDIENEYLERLSIILKEFL